MTAPTLYLDFTALAASTAAGRRLAARLVDVLCTLGLAPREGLPAAALIRASVDGIPGDHLDPGVYVHAAGDAAVIVWHTAPGRDAEPLLTGLVDTLRCIGTTGPLPTDVGAPSTFRPDYAVTWPDAADASAVLVEPATTATAAGVTA